MLELKLDTFPVLETSRLHLRMHDVKDAPILFGLRRNEQVMQYIGRPKPKDVNSVIDLINTINVRYPEKAIGWVITLKEDPETLIGTIGYWQIDFDNHRAEVGYILDPLHWRKGIISEALAAVMDFGFKTIKLHTISANIDPENEASRNMLLKHGFEKEAYFKESYHFEGKFLDTEVYGITTKIK